MSIWRAIREVLVCGQIRVRIGDGLDESNNPRPIGRNSGVLGRLLAGLLVRVGRWKGVKKGSKREQLDRPELLAAPGEGFHWEESRDRHDDRTENWKSTFVSD